MKELCEYCGLPAEPGDCFFCQTSDSDCKVCGLPVNEENSVERLCDLHIYLLDKD